MSIERSYGSFVQRVFKPSQVERTQMAPGTKVVLSKGYGHGSYFIVDSNESITLYTRTVHKDMIEEQPSTLTKGEIKTYLGTNPRMRINIFRPTEKIRWVPETRRVA